MRTAIRPRPVVLALAIVATLALVVSSLRAQPGNPNSPAGSHPQSAGAYPDRVDQIVEDDLEISYQDLMTDHLKLPLTVKSVETWLALQKPAAIPFANETSFEDVLKFLKDVAKLKDGKGVPIHVDPIGLQEAEKTMASMVALDIEDVPLATSLDLLLKQLGMTYLIQQDGIVVITSVNGEGSARDVIALISRLKEERGVLRGAVTTQRGGGRSVSPMGGMGGGFR